MRLILLVAALLASSPALAAESAPVVSPRLTATLVSEKDAVGTAPYRVGLRLRMAPGWHTYWRNPGDAGVPPELTFTLPPGTSASAPAFPIPERQPEGPLMTYGYSGEILFPVTIAGPGPVALHATWLVCARICVPEEGDFQLDLPGGAPAPSAEAPLFAAADAGAPRPMPWQASVAPDGVLSVHGEGLTADAVRDAWFIPDRDGEIEGTAPQTLTHTTNGFTLALRRPTGADGALAGLLVVTDRSGARTALTLEVPPGPAAAPALPLWEALVFAALGGLILNLMPCVFPILALKAAGLAASAQAGRSRALRHAGAYAAGVLVTFAALSLLLVGLRSAGIAAGWGFQFQSPAFVAGTAWLLFAFGLNLSGVFAVGGVNAGGALAGRGGFAGDFFTGLLAVLVATPCTAPFMGAAIAAGLAAPPAETLAVFLAMGAGLAAPYVLLAALPAFARALPRPGRWMDTLKQALAFPLYAATVWLLWVVSVEAGSPGVLATAAGFVGIGLAAWAIRMADHSSTPNGRRALAGLIGVTGIAGMALLWMLASPAAPAVAAAEAGTEPFSAGRLASLEQEGRPVFVNMTAAWCVTCLVNERVALSPAAVRDAFVSRRVIYLKGDWTRQDPGISDFLRAHGRDGVPLYVLFPGNHRPPEILPQILTASEMLDRLSTVSGS